MLTEDETNTNACGRLTHAEFGKDGSGSLTVDLADLYAPQKQYAYTKYGNCRVASGFANQAITGLRTFAVDYSGRCGAPCLFVLVDRIRGGKSKQWTWMLAEAAQVNAVAIRDNTWTLVKGGASLRATFAAPAQPKLGARLHKLELKDFKGRPLHKEFPLVVAEGGDDFFVVVTVQPKEAEHPVVKITGAGLDSKVTVGGRAVSFDGTKIVIAGDK
jgi:hypothetical protein